MILPVLWRFIFVSWEPCGVSYDIKYHRESSCSDTDKGGRI